MLYVVDASADAAEWPSGYHLSVTDNARSQT
jgi:hypothetical protein